MDIGAKIRSNGWLQGSVSRIDLAELLIEDGELISKESRAVVVSHSCDVTNCSLDKEPFCDVIIAIPTDSPESQALKNPRRLDLEFHSPKTGGSMWLRLEAQHRLSVPRHVFCDHQADDEWTLLPSDQMVLADWMAARYNRPALPDSFPRQFLTNRSAEKKFRKKVKSINESVNGIYVSLSPNGELNAGETYSATFLLLMKPEASAEEMEELRIEVEEIISGGSDMDVMVVTKKESDVSVATFRKFTRLYYDHLSQRDQDKPVDSSI